MMTRHYSLLDKILIQADSVLKGETNHSAGLMRVNHTGEVCAQALYRGQALTARSENIREQMQHAAREEEDHLAWCKQRLNELNSHTSYLNPLWYSGSLALGVIAGLAGDKWSLGFLAETERQVTKHLADHLEQLPQDDLESRKIVTQMHLDEQKHAHLADSLGAADLPAPIKFGMKVISKIMTTVAYKI